MITKRDLYTPGYQLLMYYPLYSYLLYPVLFIVIILYYSGNIVNKILFSWLIRPGHGGGSYSGVYSGGGSILRRFYFSASTLLLFSGPGCPWLCYMIYRGSASYSGPKNPRIQGTGLYDQSPLPVWSSLYSCSPHKGGAPASRPGSPASIWR